MSELPGIEAYPNSTGIVDDTLHNPYNYFGKVRVLGLAADATTLAAFVQSYLNDRLQGSNIRFELADEDPTVYMVIGDFFPIIGAHNRGNFRNRSCQFHIPVTCIDEKKNEKVTGSVQVFSYASNMWNALTSTELRGPYTLHSLMRFRTFIEDLSDDASPQTSFSMSPQVIDDEGEVTNAIIVSVQKRKEVLKGSCTSAPWNMDYLRSVFAVKQFQHQQYQTKACYEAIVQIDFSDRKVGDPLIWGVNETHDPRLEKLCVRIRQDNFHPIVESLGLKVFDTDEYDEPESELESLRIHSENCAPDCEHEVTDYLLKPVFYSVLKAEAVEEEDEHETVTRLRHQRILTSEKDDCHCGDIESDAEKASDKVTRIHEKLGKTLCYRYQIGGPNNGWNRG